MQELFEGRVAARLLASGKEFIARARNEERVMNWKGAACCYVNAARQLGHLPGQTERRAKALGRAGLCFDRNGDLEQAQCCYQDSRSMCIYLGEDGATDFLFRKINNIRKKIRSRRTDHVDVRDLQQEAEGEAAVGMQGKDGGNPPRGRCAVSELRTDRVAVLLLAGEVLRDGGSQVDKLDGGSGSPQNVRPFEPPL